MTDKSDKKIKYLRSDESIRFCCVSSFSNREKGGFRRIFKRRYSFLCISGLASLFLSGHVTLKVIFYHFHHYIFKVYKYSSRHFEKPNRVLFAQYPGVPHFLHLKQWRIANEAESLIQIQYATKPRNPE
jgi:hypothetical protein